MVILDLVDSKFEYLYDNTYNSKGDRSINIRSETVIWPNEYRVPPNVIINDKDNTNLTLDEWLSIMI